MVSGDTLFVLGFQSVMLLWCRNPAKVLGSQNATNRTTRYLRSIDAHLKLRQKFLDPDMQYQFQSLIVTVVDISSWLGWAAIKQYFILLGLNMNGPSQ